MKGNIVVIGMGQGGLTAALKLAEAGYAVDVFEKGKKGEVSYPWYDDIRYDVFELTGIPMPPRDTYTQKSKWLFVSPDCKNSLPVPPLPPMEEISMSRRGLVDHLAALAEKAGATLHYNTKVSKLVVKGDNVVGVKAGLRTYDAQLVIDASGLYSPFRGQVPKKFRIQDQPARDDIFKGWRTFYEREPGSATPDPESILTVLHMNGSGISWCNLNDRGEVDELILRTGGMSKKDFEAMDDDLGRRHDFRSDKYIRPPQPVSVGVRYSLSRMVANGYAAVGDSAFMTMPFMGCGIEAAMKAGVILAETVIRQGKLKKPVPAKALWPYQVKYYKKLGIVYYAIDLVKRIVLNLDPEDVNWAFGSGIVTSEDMKLLSTDETGSAAKLTAGDILQKVRILFSNKPLIRKLGGAIVLAVRGLLIAVRIPRRYKPRKIRRWQKKYEALVPHMDI